MTICNRAVCTVKRKRERETKEKERERDLVIKK